MTQSVLLKSILCCWTAVLCAVLAPAALGSNVSFLKNAPIAQFDEADMALLTQTAEAVLAAPGARNAREWANPKSGHSGLVETTEQYTSMTGLPCKRLRITTRAGQKSKSAVYDACLTDGVWLIGAAAKPKPQ